MEEYKFRKDEKSREKQRKILQLIYIISIFFIVIKKIAKNWQELLHRPNICIILDYQ